MCFLLLVLTVGAAPPPLPRSPAEQDPGCEETRREKKNRFKQKKVELLSLDCVLLYVLFYWVYWGPVPPPPGWKLKEPLFGLSIPEFGNPAVQIDFEIRTVRVQGRQRC